MGLFLLILVVAIGLIALVAWIAWWLMGLAVSVAEALGFGGQR